MYLPNHPRAGVAGYVPEQVVVMEEYLGFFLRGSEIVHHINGDKIDNRIDNLQLFASTADHTAFHHHNSSIPVPQRNKKGQFHVP